MRRKRQNKSIRSDSMTDGTMFALPRHTHVLAAVAPLSSGAMLVRGQGQPFQSPIAAPARNVAEDIGSRLVSPMACEATGCAPLKT